MQTTRTPIPEAKMGLPFFDLFDEMTESYADLPAIKFPAAGVEFNFAETKTMGKRWANALSNFWVEHINLPLVGRVDDPKLMSGFPVYVPSTVFAQELACSKIGLTDFTVTHMQLAKRGAELVDAGNAKILLMPDIALKTPAAAALLEQINRSGVRFVIITSPADYTPAQHKDASAFASLFPDKRVLTTSDILQYDDGKGSSINSSTNVSSVAFTSGTTGKPKGVMIPHGRAAYAYNSFLPHPVLSNMPADSDYYVTIPGHHETSRKYAVQSQLLSGRCLYMQPAYGVESFLKDILNLRQGSGLVVAPEFAFALQDCGLERGALSHIAYFQIGGSPVPESTAPRLEAIAEYFGTRFVLGYGSSEGLPQIFVSSCQPNTGLLDLVPLGDFCFRIADEDGGPVEYGQLGQLEMERGPYAFLGYLNRPDLDDETYADDGYYTPHDLMREVGKDCTGSNLYRIPDRFGNSFVIDDERYFMYPLRDALCECPDVTEAQPVRLNLSQHTVVGQVVLKKGADQVEAYDAIMAACQSLPEVLRPKDIKFRASFEIDTETGKRRISDLPDDLDGYGVNSQNSFH
ncbi:acyl--CoA ligase [Candidatus Saccharibacteria bacterium]|nr:acyl--CoA ligase [Candidatus Saccharibacteria bacterium]